MVGDIIWWVFYETSNDIRGYYGPYLTREAAERQIAYEATLLEPDGITITGHYFPIARAVLP